MKIAVTYTGNPVKHQYYIDWLKANEEIEIINLSADENNLHELDECTGLVLSGGIDIHPKFYGGEINYRGAPEKFNEERDDFEIAAFQSAQHNNIPVLGICRGMQLINVINKGTLIQDLPDESVSKVHNGNPDKLHNVIIEQDTLLRTIINQQKGEISSAHHQAIDKPGENLLVNCKADDGTIEGIEWKEKANKPFMLGIQWHPERMFQHKDSPFSKSIRDKFISVIEINASKK